MGGGINFNGFYRMDIGTMTGVSSLEKKEKSLHRILLGMGSIMVAYSGGVDSAFLLHAARKVLGEKAAGATADSPIHARRNIDRAVQFANETGARHILFSPGEMELDSFIQNTTKRCYHCKRGLLEVLSRIAREMGFSRMAHGANLDDLKEFRPGSRAAEEAGVSAPLVEAGLTKEDIRFLSRRAGLSSADLPSDSCLATRIPHGQRITRKKLEMVERAEDLLVALGVNQVRVRHLDDTAKIEVPGDDLEIILAPGIRTALVEKIKGVGFERVTVDLEGYIRGKF